MGSLGSTILPQNALKRDFNGKCIELIEGHYLEVVVLLYLLRQKTKTNQTVWVCRLIWIIAVHKRQHLPYKVMLDSGSFLKTWPRAYTTFFMLNSTEHKKTKILKNEELSCFKSLRCCIYHANKC